MYLYIGKSVLVKLSVTSSFRRSGQLVLNFFGQYVVYLVQHIVCDAGTVYPPMSGGGWSRS
jgi:hypothetical protein